jgi:2-polyprenyl-6-methoxyphenol hydroxylase-like FAD-dependent oxidoreductase
LKALNEPCPEYIFTAFAMKSFTGFEDLTGPAWLGKIAKMLKDDGAHARLVRAIEEDGVPQTVGAWQIVSMDEHDPIKWRGGRVVLVGDAVHAMAPQG